MAFSRFKAGLAAEVTRRMVASGSTLQAVLRALDLERLSMQPTKNASPLQQLCGRYTSDPTVLGKRKQTG